MLIGTHTIDLCDTCGGVWLDPIEVRLITDATLGLTGNIRTEIDSLLSHNTPAEIPTNATSSTLYCPRHATALETSTYGYSSGVTIETCPACKGLWVDGGELLRIAHFLQPTARDFLAELILQEQKNTQEAVKGITSALFLPARLLSGILTPLALLGELFYIIYVYTDNTSLHKKDSQS
jgi:Zn-finger nucleic acid-binding protein